MMKIFLARDPKTGRGLYDDESKFLGAFHSVQDSRKRTRGHVALLQHTLESSRFQL